MARKPLIIEARINEYTPRSVNEHIPFTPEEIGEAAAHAHAAGASIIHFHARDASGNPDHRTETCATTVRAIRARCDVLVHPTLGQITTAGDAAARIRHIEELAKELATRPDITPIDLGSTNLDRFRNGRFEIGNRTYVNHTALLEFLARRLREIGVKPQFVSWAIPYAHVRGPAGTRSRQCSGVVPVRADGGREHQRPPGLDRRAARPSPFSAGWSDRVVGEQ